MVNCISLPFYLYVVQQDFEQLSMELLKLDDEVEMRSCDIYIYIYIYIYIIKNDKNRENTQ